MLMKTPRSGEKEEEGRPPAEPRPPPPPPQAWQGIQKIRKWSPGSTWTVELRRGCCGSDQEAGYFLLELGEATPGCREGPEGRKEP